MRDNTRVIYGVESLAGEAPYYLFINHQDAVDVCNLENELFDLSLDPEDRGREYYTVVAYTVEDSLRADHLKKKIRAEIEHHAKRS